MGLELIALTSLLVLAALMCIWAARTGDPERPPSQHRERPAPEPSQDPDLTRVIRPGRRWYDEHPWAEDGPHGWGGFRD